MPKVQTLTPPIDGLDRFLNVNMRVGDSKDCPNAAPDVEAVQRLIAIAAGTFANEHGFPLPQPTGKFDPITAYYIYHLQNTHHSHKSSAIIDGIVSPAHGASYGGGFYTIINFNNISRVKNPTAWEALLDRYSDD